MPVGSRWDGESGPLGVDLVCLGFVLWIALCRWQCHHMNNPTNQANDPKGGQQRQPSLIPVTLIRRHLGNVASPTMGTRHPARVPG